MHQAVLVKHRCRQRQPKASRSVPRLPAGCIPSCKIADLSDIIPERCGLKLAARVTPRFFSSSMISFQRRQADALRDIALQVNPVHQPPGLRPDFPERRPDQRPSTSPTCSARDERHCCQADVILPGYGGIRPPVRTLGSEARDFEERLAERKEPFSSR